MPLPSISVASVVRIWPPTSGWILMLLLAQLLAARAEAVVGATAIAVPARETAQARIAAPRPRWSLLFMYFLFQTGFRGSFAARADSPVRLPLPVEGFLLADPFVGAMTLLSTHTVYRGLLWSVVSLPCPGSTST